uniref:Uncharacterized protein n=1 Tax=Noctiluca scintillans TaxID=2966 RepID=A0A7S1FJB3_NOCSC|mmetsp:Transcript_8955/g.24976  ORF Transcript_8955/g.24976 Transcript_8955/m.24976 type:complete len:199 (+) Transcript_8955:60-656(+)|eukprot:CAMPEP_0194504452 /NCGR_PEP_ID=MMETSP0253-20130528/28953_1 /TAXON_ID=2966 /ORGANISM="Noctiluca scintillans" /LENGTH=198 /DNA_ID=CAMNT_0039346841 /DNA_START=23 /DNA_END=619 /DNA_ORIENTATION=+
MGSSVPCCREVEAGDNQEGQIKTLTQSDEPVDFSSETQGPPEGAAEIKDSSTKGCEEVGHDSLESRPPDTKAVVATEAKSEQPVKKPRSRNRSAPKQHASHKSRSAAGAGGSGEWIGTCNKNVLKADPQLTGACSGCQCGNQLELHAVNTEFPLKSPETKAPLTEEQMKKAKEAEARMKAKAKKLEAIGQTLDECNQQ